MPPSMSGRHPAGDDCSAVSQTHQFGEGMPTYRLTEEEQLITPCGGPRLSRHLNLADAEGVEIMAASRPLGVPGPKAGGGQRGVRLMPGRVMQMEDPRLIGRTVFWE